MNPNCNFYFWYRQVFRANNTQYFDRRCRINAWGALASVVLLSGLRLKNVWPVWAIKFTWANLITAPASWHFCLVATPMNLWEHRESATLVCCHWWLDGSCDGVLSWRDSVSSSRTVRTRRVRSRSSMDWSAATAARCSRAAPVASTRPRTRTPNHWPTRIHFGKQHSADRHFQSQGSSCVSLVELEFAPGGGGGGGGGGGLSGGLGGGMAAGGPTSYGRDTPENTQQFCCCVILW